MAKDATPEQVAAYRKDNGIPEKPEGYLEALPKTLELQDIDRKILAPYLARMQELNIRPEIAASLIELRQVEAERQIDERLEADRQMSSRLEETLRGEWGREYGANINSLKGFINQTFGEAAEAFLSGRDGNGDPLLANQHVVRALLQLANDTRGGNITIATADGRMIDGAGVEARISEIEKLMGDSSSEYYKGAKAEAIQAEYRKLIDAREANKRRAA